MDKYRLIGWFLIFGIILFWFQTQQKELEEKHKLEQRQKDSLAALKSDSTPASPPPALKAIDPASESVAPSQASPADTTDTLQAPAITERKFWVETQQLVIGLSSKGAAIQQVFVKDLYPNLEKSASKILDEPQGFAALNLANLDMSEIIWEPSEIPSDTLKIFEGKKTLSFTTLVSGTKVIREYTFHSDSNSISHHLQTGELHIPHFAVAWNNGLIETENIPKAKGIGLTANFFSEVIINEGENFVSRERFSGEQKFNEQSGVLRWIGLRRKYLATVINFYSNTQFKATAKEIPIQNEFAQSTFSLQIEGEDFEPGDLNFTLQVLPLKHKELLAFGEGYEKILFSGYSWFFGADSWYPKLCGMVLTLLNKFYKLIPNYGIAIILLTLLVRLILLPLTISQTKAMSKQQQLAPHLKELREKHKGNPQKMFAAQRELYKEKGVSQAGFLIGCLPMFLQLPVFIALFNVLGRAVELREANFFAWISDLSRPDVIAEALQIPYIFPMGITVLPFFMAITMYFQTKMTITDPNQKPMVYMMPVMMFVFSASFPSGLVLYWTISNVFTIVQTKMLKKPLPQSTGPVKEKLPANAIGKKKKGKKT